MALCPQGCRYLIINKQAPKSPNRSFACNKFNQLSRQNRYVQMNVYMELILNNRAWEKPRKQKNFAWCVYMKTKYRIYSLWVGVKRRVLSPPLSLSVTPLLRVITLLMRIITLLKIIFESILIGVCSFMSFIQRRHQLQVKCHKF